MLLIPELGKQRLEDQYFKASLGYLVSLRLVGLRKNLPQAHIHNFITKFK